MFFVLFSNIFLRVFRGHFKALFDKSESILYKQFFINFNFDFGVLAQKSLKPCANGVFKFQFFFLDLSSKVLAGVGVRMSKYPYMDICEECRQEAAREAREEAGYDVLRGHFRPLPPLV